MPHRELRELLWQELSGEAGQSFAALQEGLHAGRRPAEAITHERLQQLTDEQRWLASTALRRPQLYRDVRGEVLHSLQMEMSVDDVMVLMPVLEAFQRLLQ